MTAWIKGTRVRHNKKPDWGVGQLLEDSNNENIRVFFENAGEKKLVSATASSMTVLQGLDTQSSLLDNLYLPGPGQSRPMVTMSQAKMRLQEMFPGGLHGDRMKKEERSYKDELSRLADGWYAANTLQSALDENRYSDIVELAYQLVRHSKNIFPASFEKIAFGNAVKGFTRSREFAEAFCTWVLPDQPQQQAFEAFADELENMGCAKWPILTPYRFLLHPNMDVLIKPENLKHASELARFDINYRPELNWITYTKVMEFYRHISVQIADLNPRDMIDVQNFIWCIDPDQYPG